MTRFLIYVAIGIVVLAVDLFTLSAALNAGLGRDFGIAIAILAAMAVQYSLNRRYNFRASGTPIWPQLPRYVIVTAANILATIAIVRLTVTAFGLPVILAKLVSLPITTPPTFLAHSYFTFGHRQERANGMLR